jgi:neutral ceramidase
MRPTLSVLLASILITLAAATVTAADYKAGIGRIDITPKSPIWMSGYASRNHPSEGVVHPLWAKALAIEDAKGNRVVVVTSDLIGLPRAVSDVVSARVLKQYGLDRSRLVLNSSHTHTGPVVGQNLVTMWNLPDEAKTTLQQYAQTLTDDLVTVVGAALSDLAPAQISYGIGEAGFAMNRREFTPKGVRIGVNPNGPTDHSVPILRIAKPDGTLRAVLFGYACHNTTLTGDYYKLTGDYAGYAQAHFEKAHPGSTALFMMVCGGDQNPEPRGTLEMAEQHGRELADEVSTVLETEMERVSGPIRAAFQTTELPLAPHTRDTFEAMKSDKVVAKQRLAEAMLKEYDQGHPRRTVLYPAQAIRFGGTLTLLALGGEVTVPYDLRAKKEFPKSRLIVAGYSNDVMCYIPTAQMLKEGGYEAVDSMYLYGMPATFTDEVEDRVFELIHRVMKRVGN